MAQRKFYIVRLRADDSIVAVGSAAECAERLKMTVPTFRTTASRFRNGMNQKYEIDVELEEDDARQRNVLPGYCGFGSVCRCRGLPGHGVDQGEKWEVNMAEKKLTNADRIRAMTDQQLAGVIDNLQVCGHRSMEECTTKYCRDCKECILDWLKQEVE